MADLKTSIRIEAETRKEFGWVLRGEITLPDFVRSATGRRGNGAELDETWAARLPAEYLRDLLDSSRLDDGTAMALACFAAKEVLMRKEEAAARRDLTEEAKAVLAQAEGNA